MSDVAAPDPWLAGPPAVGRARVPAPRQPGTVYRADPDHPAEPGLATDGGGSLTGFILSRGRTDAPAPRWRMVAIGLVILLMIAVLAAIGLFAVGTLFDSILGDRS
jgi:hypothetical protein